MLTTTPTSPVGSDASLLLASSSPPLTPRDANADGPAREVPASDDERKRHSGRSSSEVAW
jgi:hypothetical protein